MSTPTKKTSLVDYAALAADVRSRQKEGNLDLKDIAAQSGVDKSKLSILVNLKGGLATDNLLLVCDWLGKSVEDYRLREVPDWLIERLAQANNLTAEEAEQMASDRLRAASRQAASVRALRQLDPAALLAAAQEAGAAMSTT
jgi:hypothetical protein